MRGFEEVNEGVARAPVLRGYALPVLGSEYYAADNTNMFILVFLASFAYFLRGGGKFEKILPPQYFYGRGRSFYPMPIL